MCPSSAAFSFNRIKPCHIIGVEKVGMRAVLFLVGYSGSFCALVVYVAVITCRPAAACFGLHKTVTIETGPGAKSPFP